MKLEPGARVTGADLGGIDWSELDVTGAVFEDCRMADVQLSGAVLEEARFSKCRFVRCRFAKVDMRSAVFEECGFADDEGHTGAVFAFSRMDQAHFLRCDLSFARIDRSELYGTEFETCNLRGSTFTKADFGRAFNRKLVKYAGALKGCNLELADLAELRMPDCDLNNTSFREAVLLDADLEGADMRGCDLVQALTAGAKCARADLRGADLGGLRIIELATFDGMMVSADQQHALLSALGIDVHPEDIRVR